MNAINRFVVGVVITGVIYSIPFLFALGATAFVLWDGNFANWDSGSRFGALFGGVLCAAFFVVPCLEIGGARQKAIRSIIASLESDQ